VPLPLIARPSTFVLPAHAYERIAKQVQPSTSMVLDKSGDDSLGDCERLRSIIVECMEFLLSLTFHCDEVNKNRFYP